jgi:pimeloyl-ACP methyl ester carboxylesterase
MLPFQILGMWLRGLLSIALLIGGPYLVHRWYERAHVERVDESGTVRREFAPNWGFNSQTAVLAVGVAATVWAIPKGPISLTRLRRPRGNDEPKRIHPGEVREVLRPDGTKLRVEMYGPAAGPIVVLTHGWGADSTLWFYSKKRLNGCRVVVWDLPGAGLSDRAANNDYSVDRMASDLDAVIREVAGDRPVVLVGHSIGGMISLKFLEDNREAMHTRVAGLVLLHTTYTNPVRTTRWAEIHTSLQKPLYEPLMYLTIAISPLVWAMNWLGYINGSTHRAQHRTGFSGRETRGQLDFVASFGPRVSPAVLARGMLGMFRFDASAALAEITVPTLVIPGDRDKLTTPQASQQMAERIPGATLHALSPARHQGMIEHHETFDQTLAAFVRRCINSAKVSATATLETSQSH